MFAQDPLHGRKKQGSVSIFTGDLNRQDIFDIKDSDYKEIGIIKRVLF